MTSTTETEILPALNPIELLNERISSKKKEAGARLQKLRSERAAFEKTSVLIGPGDGPAEAAKLESAWQDERDRKRRAERTFSEMAILMELDDERGSKAMLVRALAYLKDKAKAVQEEPSVKVEQPVGRHLFQAPDAFAPQATPAPHALPVGGLFGVEVLPPLTDALSELESEVKAFPERLPFYKIVDMANRLDSRLHRAAPPPPLAKRFDKPFLPKHG